MAGKTVSMEQEKKKQEMAMENNIMEMERLRSELNTFKERLDKQQIVNDQLMRQSMKSKMSWIRKMLWIEVAFIPILRRHHGRIGLSDGAQLVVVVLHFSDACCRCRTGFLDQPHP